MRALIPGLAFGVAFGVALAPARAAEPVATSAAPPPVVGRGVEFEDATMDRSLVVPTALTQPAGKVVLNSYEIFILGVSVGLTDRLQLTVTSQPFDLGRTRFVLGNLKWQVARTARARLAVFAGVVYAAREPSHHELPPGTRAEHAIQHGVGPQAGVAFSWCLEATCHSLVNATVAAHRELGRDSDGYLLASGSLVGRISASTKIVLEIGRGGDFTTRLHDDHVTVVAAGVRFFHHAAALDLGVAVDAFADFPSPFPVLSLSARF